MAQLRWLEATSESDVEAWSKTHAKLPADIYHSPKYALLYRSEGAPCCALFACDLGTVLYPFLVRPIDEQGGSTPSCDLITPYGYGGAVVAASDPASQGALFARFLEAFDAAAKEHHVVSEFIRLHPLLGNAALYPAADLHLHHDTVVIDLGQSAEDLWRGIRKGHKSSIRKAEREGVKILVDDSGNFVDEFAGLYHSTMERQSADAKYYLPHSFFRETLSQLERSVFMAVATHKSRVVSAAMFLVGRQYAHYHFSGSNREALDVSANHALLYEVILRCKQDGLLALNLGGGLAADDTLFRFKSGFSPLRKSFHTGRRIHDHAAYDRLVEERFERSGPRDESFFPLYRAPRQPGPADKEVGGCRRMP